MGKFQFYVDHRLCYLYLNLGDGIFRWAAGDNSCSEILEAIRNHYEEVEEKPANLVENR